MIYSPEYTHACDRVGLFTTIYWNELEEGIEYEFEILDYFASPVVKEGQGHYHIFMAIPTKDFPIGGMNIKKGDMIELHVSYRTFVKALQKLSAELRTPCLRKFIEGKNVIMRFKKLDVRRLAITHQEPREPMNGMKEEAGKFYSMITNSRDEYEQHQ